MNIWEHMEFTYYVFVDCVIGDGLNAWLWIQW